MLSVRRRVAMILRLLLHVLNRHVMNRRRGEAGWILRVAMFLHFLLHFLNRLCHESWTRRGELDIGFHLVGMTSRFSATATPVAPISVVA